MIRLFLLAAGLFPALLALSACAKREAAFVEVGRTYTFYVDHDVRSNWVRGRVLDRTDDGWFLVKFEGEERWLNGKRTLFIMEKK